MKKPDTDNSLFSAFQQLYKDAKEGGNINFLYTLIRVGGITREPDPLHVLLDVLGSKNASYCDIAPHLVVLEILQHLLNCSTKTPYRAVPFRSLYKQGERGWVPPTTFEAATFVSDAFKKAGRYGIADEIATAYQFADKCGEDGLDDTPELIAALKVLKRIVRITANIYRRERRVFIGSHKYHKLPDFIVLEPMIDETDGVYGFTMYFSNGSNAFFARYQDHTDARNIFTGLDEITFMCGRLDQRVPEWRVGDKRLYEVGGIPGRYNAIGEWKPLVYPGETATLQKDSHTLADGDFEVEGALFYMMCTGHRVIEFAAKTPIELPLEGCLLGKRLHFWKCPEQTGKDYTLYDGQYDLDAVDPKSIRVALASINVGLNRMAFAFGSEIQWSVKYNARIKHSVPRPTPSNKDLDILDSLLKDFPTSEDAIALDIALDWYHKGELAKRKNIFLAFLSFYISFELIAIAIAEGDVDLGLGFHPRTPAQRNERRIASIRAKHDALYESDPIKFIREAYFDDVVGLKRKTRAVAEFIFGSDDEYVKALFESTDNNPCLSDLRGELAHGGITLLSREDEKMIEEKLPLLSEIAADFLKRLIFRGKEKMPTWSGSHSVAMYTDDPRTTKITTDIRMIGGQNQSWVIRAEWLD